MAPQNSTLIHESKSSNIETTSDDISHYSPILPAKSKRNSRNCGRKSDYSQESVIETDVDVEEEKEEIPIWVCGEPRFVSGVTNITTCNDVISALIDDEIKTNSSCGKDVTMSRDPSDYMITERWRDVEQPLAGDTRILSIWIAWGNVKNEVQFRLKINRNNVKNAQQQKAAQQQQQHDKENKSKKEKIGLINRMVRKVLKQGEAIQNQLSMISQKSTEKRSQERFRKYVKEHCGKNMIMETFLNDTTALQTISHQPSDSKQHEHCKCCQKSKRSSFSARLFSTVKRSGSKEPKVLKNKYFDSIENLESVKNEDELLLVIDHTSDSDSGIYTHNPRQHHSKKRESVPRKLDFGSMVEIDRLAKDEKTPKRRFRSHRQYETLKNRNFSKRLSDCNPDIDDFDLTDLRKGTFQRTSFRYDLLKQEMSTKMSELQHLLNKEEDLLRKLKLKSAKFQAENKLYRSQFAINYHVDRLQESIDKCATEIIDIERDLLETKIQIEEKTPLVENLKAILKEQEVEDQQTLYSNHADSFEMKRLSSCSSSRPTGSIDFVDNIYEFCDNNKSFVV